MNSQIAHPKYRPDIDGLRAIAVLSVVVYHAFPSALRGGFAGVDVFFVISGFLISTILFENIDRGTFKISDFYSRRIRRVFPALALVLFSVLIFGSVFLFPGEMKQLGKHVASSAGFIQNYVLWSESGYFDNASETKPLLHIWSLGIEEQFYIIWPLLLVGAAKFGKQKRQFFYLLATVIVFALSFALNIELVKDDPTKTFYLPQYRFWELAIGGILSWVVLYQPSFVNRFRGAADGANVSVFSMKRVNDLIGFGGFVALFVIFGEFSKDTIFPGKMALLPVLATVAIIFAGSESFANKQILSNKFFVWCGLISFPLYLWHWPLLSFGRILYGQTPPNEFLVSAVLLSIVLAWLTMRFIERPFRFGNSNNAPKIAVLCSSVLAAGVIGFVSSERIDDGKVLSKSEEETNAVIASSEENCKKIFPHWLDKDGVGTDQWCRVQNGKPTIALVGDSHSGQLFYGFIDALKGTSESVANFPASCAAPLLDTSTGITRALKYRENNGRLMNDAFEYIGNSPTIRTVYLAHNPDCSFGKGTSIDLENPAEKDDEIILKNGLIRTLNFLRSKNKNVVIVLDNPAFPFLPSKCKSRGAFFDSFKGECKIEIHSPSRERYKRLVMAVVSDKFPNVKIFDLEPYFCSSGQCSPIHDGQFFYNDNDSGHMNHDGSVSTLR